MKNPFTKREIVLVVVAIASLLIVIVAGVYVINNFQQQQTVRNQSNSASLTAKDAQLNKLANYNTTICGEYRKLYKAYKDISSQTPSEGSGYALPGSAKGQVDECYQPE